MAPSISFCVPHISDLINFVIVALAFYYFIAHIYEKFDKKHASKSKITFFLRPFIGLVFAYILSFPLYFLETEHINLIALVIITTYVGVYLFVRFFSKYFLYLLSSLIIGVTVILTLGLLSTALPFKFGEILPTYYFIEGELPEGHILNFNQQEKPSSNVIPLNQGEPAQIQVSDDFDCKQVSF